MSWFGPANRAYTQANFVGGSGAAPALAQILLQGQTAQQQTNYINGLSNPSAPNSITLGWIGVPGATSYNIYRSVSSGNASGVTQGAYAFLANVSAASAASAYSSYVAASQSYGYSRTCNCAYVDTAATNCVGYQRGTPNSTNQGEYFNNAGTSGTGNYAPVGYTYKVSAVTATGEGALSSDSIIVYFAGGDQITNQGIFNNGDQLTYADTTCPLPSPLGLTTNALWTGADSFINPFSGWGACDQNLNMKGLNYIVINVYPQQSGLDLTAGPELAGDYRMLADGASDPSLSAYYPGGSGSTLPAAQWTSMKIPISALWIDSSSTNTFTNAQQWSFYKITLGSHGPGGGNPAWLEWYFSR